MENLWQDLRYGLRVLWKNRSFTLIAIIALALGIGANTLIFSLINVVLLRQLPFPQPERLVQLYANAPERNLTETSPSYTKFVEIAKQPDQLEAVAAIAGDGFNVSGAQEPEQLSGIRVSADFFKVFGVQPALGRDFLLTEDQPGGNDVVLLSHRFWQRRFGGNAQVVGTSINLNNKTHTIIGVLPASFNYPFNETDLWLPRVFDVSYINQEQLNRGAGFINIYGRLKPGATVAGVQEQLKVIAGNYQQQYPERVDARFTLSLIPLQERFVRSIRTILMVLFGAVGFVLLIACANVANLLLARAMSRRKEFAVRTALGASRWRLLQQLITESVILSLMGGVVGLLLALWGLSLVTSLAADSIPRINEVTIDSQVMIFTLGISLLTGLIFGLAPALQITNTNLNVTLKEGGRGNLEGIRHNRFRSVLVVAEVGLALVLLIGAGLLIQSFMKLQSVNPGFNTSNLLIFQVNLPRYKYAEKDQQIAYSRQMSERLAAIPGVQSVTAADSLPLFGGKARTPVTVEGRTDLPQAEWPIINRTMALPGYFHKMNISLIKGREFTEQDAANNSAVAIINEKFAKQFFANTDPIGKHIYHGLRDPKPCEIIGVVADVRQESISDQALPEMFRPYYQLPTAQLTFAVRANIAPQNIIGAVRNQAFQLDKDLPLTNMNTMAEVMATAMGQPRLIVMLLGFFAGVALLLASVGIYGVISYSVAQRTTEIGIRMALGAQSSDVIKLVLGQGILLAGAGVIVGLIASFALMRAISSLLFDVSQNDPLTYLAVSLFLFVVALLACFIPARRATKVDPMVALRCD